MEQIPTAVNLTTYAGEAEDFMRLPLYNLLEQITQGTLKIQIGKTFKLDEIVEAIALWRRIRLVERSWFLPSDRGLTWPKQSLSEHGQAYRIL